MRCRMIIREWPLILTAISVLLAWEAEAADQSVDRSRSAEVVTHSPPRPALTEFGTQEQSPVDASPGATEVTSKADREPGGLDPEPRTSPEASHDLFQLIKKASPSSATTPK